MTAILVDTHIALWALGEQARLTDAERALLTRATTAMRSTASSSHTRWLMA